MPLDEQRAEELFYALLEHSDPVRYDSALDAACGDDAQLRQRVERLLIAHRQLGDFLGTPSARLFPGGSTAELASAQTDGPDNEEATWEEFCLLGQVIDNRYRLLEVLGE